MIKLARIFKLTWLEQLSMLSNEDGPESTPEFEYATADGIFYATADELTYATSN